MFSLDITSIILVLLVMLLAYIVKGIAGFGSGLIAVPILAIFFPLTMVVPMLGLVSYSGTIAQSYQFRRHVSWKDCVSAMPFALGGVLTALWLFQTLDLNWLNRMLAVFIIGYAVLSLIPSKSRLTNRGWGLPAGFLAGFTGTLFGTGGPFYVVYLKLRKLDKQAFRATIVMIFLFDGGIRIVAYGVSGFYNQNVLLLAILSLPVLVLGLFIGHRLHLSVSARHFNHLISVLLLVSGVVLLYK